MLTTTATELPRLMACIGSRLMPAALPPDHDHEMRDEGNAAHWLAKEAFEGRPVVPGQKAFNGYVITEDMMDHVKTYLDALDCGNMEVETTFAGVEWEVRGRADHIDYRDNTLTVDDFKYGWRIVSPENNWTLIAHALGWCIRNNTAPQRIVLRIHQPRPYHPDGPVREWSISYLDLMDRYGQVAQRLGYPDDTLATSGQCAKCHALPTCPAARAASMNAIDATSVAFNDTLPPDVLAFEFETMRIAKATIENRFNAIEELMTHKINTGTVFHGYGLKVRRANRSWKAGLNGDVLSIAAGMDLRKVGVVTPAEAERRGLSESALTALTDRAIIGTKLERINVDAEARKALGKQEQR